MITQIICALLYVIIAPFLGGLLAGIDRKITARMQGRIGPSIFQPFYDVAKLLNKQIMKINNMQYPFALCFLIFVVITGALFFGGADILLVFFTLTTAALFFILEAATTNSPFSVMGSEREIIQMLAYEPMMLLVAVGFYMANGTFSVAEIINAEYSSILRMPGLFIGFLYILTIKLRKSPFDLSTSHHAHQEVVKGITTELSGRMFAFVEIAHWYENVFLLGVIGLFIINASWWSIPLALVVIALCYFMEILIDNCSARVKWNLMFRSAWLVTLIFGVANIIILQYVLK
ncbi:MAG: NADH-quinone oxidoreductase subunit H [Clostridia bacterium]|nr:NADH-quinone oxidoreductase subunit H [Clostridia bacterium]